MAAAKLLSPEVTYDQVKNLSFSVSPRLIPNDTLINSDAGGRSAQCRLDLIDTAGIRDNSIMCSITDSSLIHWTRLSGYLGRERNNQASVRYLHVAVGRQ